MSNTPSIEQHASQAVKRMRRYVIIGVIVLVLLILAPFVYTAVAIYGIHSENKFTDTMIHRFPYPMATVNGQWIHYSEYKTNVAQARRMYAQFANDPQFSAQTGSVPSNEEINKLEFDRMVQVMILEQLASEYGITASTEEIEAEYNATVTSQLQGDEASIEQTLQELYGWSTDQFKQIVIREVILRTKVQDYLLANQADEFGGEAKQQIDDIQKQLQADPTKFAELARLYSQDGSAESGGELGFFGRGMMVPEFEEAAFALNEPNSVSPIVQTQYGYHLIQLIERKEASGDEPEQINARHILIQVSLDQYLQEQVNKAKIKKYIEPEKAQIK